MDDPASPSSERSGASHFKGEGFSLSLDDRARQLQQALADRLKADGLLDDWAIENAFRTVPRHLFLPNLPPEKVYIDEAIGTKFLDDGRAISSSSQPAIMAIMLAQLDLMPGLKVLEIGTGTGYNAALMAQIVGAEGSVVSLDIDQDIVLGAQTHLDEAGFERVTVACCDGFQGRLDRAPYDRIVLTVGSADIAPAWWQQLARGGRLVMPLELAGHSTMVSVVFDLKDGYLESNSVRTCGFMMLRGMGGGEPAQDSAAETPDTFVAPFDHAGVDGSVVARDLVKGARDLPSEVNAAQWVLERDVRFWLERHGYRCFVLCRRRGRGVHLSPELPAILVGYRDQVETCLGVLRGEALCTLSLFRSSIDSEGVGHIWVSSYGESRAMAREIVGSLQRWRDDGFVSLESARIRAYPVGEPIPPAQIVIEKCSVRLLLDWPEEGSTAE